MSTYFEAIVTLLTVLGIGGILGSWVTHLLERRWELEKKAVLKKEEQYKKFLELLLAFFKGWEDNKKKKEFMEELYTHAILYASDEVIRAANSFLKSFGGADSTVGTQSDQFYKKLVLAIRRELKDLHNSKTELKMEDLEILKLDG